MTQHTDTSVTGSAPAVSVIMVVTGKAERLGEPLSDFVVPAAESILAQSFTDFECIIVDDNTAATTDDGTPGLLDELAGRDPRVRVLRNAEPAGIAAALNRALNEARGEYVAVQDPGGVSHPDRLAHQVAVLAARPEVAVLGAGCRLIDLWDAVVRYRVRMHQSLAEALQSAAAVFPHGAAMYRREAALAQGGYDERLLYLHDMDLWFKLFHAGARVAVLDEPLLLFRRFPATRRETVLQREYSRLIFGKHVLGMDVEETMDKLLDITRRPQGEPSRKMRKQAELQYFLDLAVYAAMDGEKELAKTRLNSAWVTSGPFWFKLRRTALVFSLLLRGAGPTDSFPPDGTVYDVAP